MTRKHISIKNIIGRKIVRSNFSKDNEGLSLVELIVAVAILAVVFTPIVNSFLTTSKTNARAQSIQNATSLAEAVMEEIKAKSIDQLKEEALVDTSMTVTEEYASATPKEGERPISYTIEYKDKTATNGKKYDVNVVVDSQSYSYKKGVVKADGTFPDDDDISDANLADMPAFKEIDSSNNAIISWEINRYDGIAMEVLMEQIAGYDKNHPEDTVDTTDVDGLESGNPMNKMWYKSGVFPVNSLFMKEINVDLKYNGNKAYVTCVVSYKKNLNKERPGFVRDIEYDPISYEVYSSQFDIDNINKSPDIYIFYTLMCDDKEVIQRNIGGVSISTDFEQFNINVMEAPASEYNSKVYFIVQKRAGKESEYALSQNGSDISLNYHQWGDYYVKSNISGLSTDNKGFISNKHRVLSNMEYSYIDDTETINLDGNLYYTQKNDNIYEITVNVLDGSDTEATLTSTFVGK